MCSVRASGYLVTIVAQTDAWADNILSLTGMPNEGDGVRNVAWHTQTRPMRYTEMPLIVAHVVVANTIEPRMATAQ